jgi:hypothetical protein
VFISHAHADRGVAVELDEVLRKHQAATFLDQEEIEAGDVLPARLKEGIAWCNRFLLLWSMDADRSSWVKEEWNYAYDERKRIVPYRLDGCPLPEALENLVYIDLSDRRVGDGKLLSTIFGREFRPADPTEIYPGRWRAALAIAGLGAVTYDLELRANGQIVGAAQMGQSGVLGQLARGHGLDHLLNLKGRLRGQWTYDDVAQTLTLDITAELLGQSQREVIRISTTEKDHRALQGLDEVGRPWVVQRIS